MVTDPIAIFLILAIIVYLSLILEERYDTFRSLGSALVGILFAMILANIGFIPGKSAAYDFLVGPGVRAGVVLILLSVDIGSIRQAGPKMLIAFGIGALGTAAGAVISALLLSSTIGEETWKLSGQFTGTYTGGGLNFAAVGQALNTSGDLFTAGIAADVIITAVWMMACLAVPVLLGKESKVSSAGMTLDSNLLQTNSLERALYNTGHPVPLSHAAAHVAIAFGVLWGADQIGSVFQFLPNILWLTTLTLLLAQIPSVKRLTGSAMWGNYLLLLFLASNGASSVIANIIRVGPAVFYFATITILIHGIIIFGLGRLCGIDFITLAVASQANVGGPASAMAMSSARGNTETILPGVAVGLLGYAAGNYLGLFIAAVVRTLIS